MIEPVALTDFFITFFSSALVVLFGAAYAALFAWAKLHPRKALLLWAYACYVALVAAVLVLSDAAHLSGAWRAVTAAMLLGYLWAPHGIWRLCTASHR